MVNPFRSSQVDKPSQKSKADNLSMADTIFQGFLTNVVFIVTILGTCSGLYYQISGVSTHISHLETKFSQLDTKLTETRQESKLSFEDMRVRTGKGIYLLKSEITKLSDDVSKTNADIYLLKSDISKVSDDVSKTNAEKIKQDQMQPYRNLFGIEGVK